MIFYLVTRGDRRTINRYRQSWGRPLHDRITPYPYEDVWKTSRLPAGTYIFADLERLSIAEAEATVAVWDAVTGAGMTALNHPTRSMRRYELLRSLRERRTNDFDVYRATEARVPARFPVFVRGENDHDGNATPLLDGPAALDGAIADLQAQGASRERLLIEEFCDTADADGVYRKYSAFRIGDRIVPRHVFFKRSWVVKVPSLVTPELVDEELGYVHTNPHEAELRAIFALARIDYGRIDYAVKDGRVQVWEINTNPQLLSFQDGGGPARLPTHEWVARHIEEAFRAIDQDRAGTIPIGGGVAARALRAGVAEVYHWTVRSLGLLNREAEIMADLKRWTRRRPDTR